MEKNVSKPDTKTILILDIVGTVSHTSALDKVKTLTVFTYHYSTSAMETTTAICTLIKSKLHA